MSSLASPQTQLFESPLRLITFRRKPLPDGSSVYVVDPQQREELGRAHLRAYFPSVLLGTYSVLAQAVGYAIHIEELSEAERDALAFFTAYDLKHLGVRKSLSLAQGAYVVRRLNRTTYSLYERASGRARFGLQVQVLSDVEHVRAYGVLPPRAARGW